MDGTTQALVYVEENRSACLTAIFAALEPAQILATNFIDEELPLASDMNSLRDKAELMERELRRLYNALTSEPCMAYMAAFSGLSNWKRLVKTTVALWRLKFTVPRLHTGLELRMLLKRRLCLIKRLITHTEAVFRSACKAHREAVSSGVDGVPERPATPKFCTDLRAEGSSSGGGAAEAVARRLAMEMALASMLRR